VSGQKQIGSAVSQTRHRHSCATDQFAIVIPFRKIKRMMGDYRFDQLIARAAKLFTNACNLTFVDASALHRQRTGGIHSHHDYLIVDISRMQVIGNVPLVLIQRSQKTRQDIVKRNIVITGNDNLWFRQSVEKGAGLAKLVRARSLRQVARNGH